MKKYLFLMIALLTLFTLFSCKEEEDTKDTVKDKEVIQQEEKEEIVAEDIVEEKEDFTQWKIIDKIVTSNEEGLARGMIKLPKYGSNVWGYGQLASQEDGTIIFLGRESDEEINDEKIETVLDQLIYRSISAVTEFRNKKYKDFAFVTETTELLTVKDYDFCKHIGKHTYTLDGVAQEKAFVAYVTKLKENGAYIYWLVLDDTDDQSLNEKIHEYAYGIANTLYEE